MRAHGSGLDQSDTTSYDTRLRYSLQSDLLGYPQGTPMVAPGLSGPRQNYRAPSVADRQPALTMAKKELVKGVWRADEWREFPAFQRALKRYLRLADSTLLEFFEFWLPLKSLSSDSYSFLQVDEQLAVDAYHEYTEKNRAVLACMYRVPRRGVHQEYRISTHG